MFLPYPEECPKDEMGAIATLLPHVTWELYETTCVPSGSTEYKLAAIFSTATVMAVKNAPLVYAANSYPLPSEETWYYGGRCFHFTRIGRLESPPPFVCRPL
jgi:hypothetical protein